MTFCLRAAVGWPSNVRIPHARIAIAAPFLAAFRKRAVCAALPRERRARGTERSRRSPDRGIAAVFCVALALALVAPRLLGYTPFAVLSGSMEPAYPVGSLIYVQPVEASSLRVGDAVTFVANDQGTVATHRVIDVDGDSALLRTQGDANVAPTETPFRSPT